MYQNTRWLSKELMTELQCKKKNPKPKRHVKEVGARAGYKGGIQKHCPGMLGWS